MGRLYYCPFPAATVTNAGGNADLWEIIPADDKPCHIRGIILGQTSELSDAAEEALAIDIVHMAATFTSGNGTSITPVPVDVAVGAAAGFTAEYNGATVATSSGTSTIVFSFVWNIRSSPYELWFPDPAFAPTVRQAAGMVVRMNSTVADDITFAGTLVVEED